MQNSPAVMPMIQPAAQNAIIAPALPSVAPQAYAPTAPLGQDVYESGALQEQPEKISVSSNLLTSFAQSAGTIAAGGAVGGGTGALISLKSPSKEAITEHLSNLLVIRRPADILSVGLRDAEKVLAEAQKAGTESTINSARGLVELAKQNVSVAASNIMENAKGLTKELAKTDVDAVLYKEAKTLAKKFSRTGIIGTGIAIGAFGLCLAKAVQGFMPTKTQEAPALSAAEAQPAYTVQG